MEETRSISQRTFKGKSTILFLFHLFIRVFIVILCPVALVFTFQKKLIMAGEWALNFPEFLLAATLLIVGGSVIFSLLCLIIAPFTSLLIEGSKVIFKRRFSKKNTAVDLAEKKSANDKRNSVMVFAKKKRNFLGEAIILRDDYQDIVLWEASFPSAVWKEISIYLFGLSSESQTDD